MTKLTVIGDPHITPKNIEKFSEVLTEAEKLGHIMVLLGDVLDTKEVVRSSCLNFIYERLKAYSEHVYILVGNHDWHNLQCQDHSLRTLNSLPNVTVVDKPVEETIAGKQILFLPYYDDVTEFKKQFKKAKDLAFIHQGIVGFDYGNGYLADGSGHGEVSLKDVTKSGVRVISGHFHKYAEKDNFTFLGTPFSGTFGESNQDKHFGVLDLSNLELELIPTNLPKHITVDVACENPPEKLELDPENYNRVIITGTKEQLLEFDYSIIPDNTKILKRCIQVEALELSADETLDNKTLFATWAENVELNPEVVELGLEYLR